MTERNGDRSVGYVVTKHEYDGRNGPIIDLGLGTSPIGPAQELREPLRLRNPFDDLSSYSEDPLHIDTRRLVIDMIGLEGFNPDCVVFNGNASYGAGDEVLRYLSLTGYKALFAANYSFPNVAQWTIRHGVTYNTLDTEHLSPISSLEAVLDSNPSAVNKNIFYIDYPNNPFGLAEPDLLRQTVDYVSKNNGIPIVDLAFGEVLGDEFHDAIQYTLDRGGICLASLSKTQGFPKTRGGYAIMPDRFTQDGYSGNQRMVYGLAGESEFICQQLYTPVEGGKCLAKIHADRVADYNKVTNLHLYQSLEQLGLEIKPTDLRTPIQVVASNCPDFYQRLVSQGIVTESLHDYRVTLGNGSVGYDHSAVRMLTPRPGQLEEVIRRTQIAIG